VVVVQPAKVNIPAHPISTIDFFMGLVYQNAGALVTDSNLNPGPPAIPWSRDFGAKRVTYFATANRRYRAAIYSRKATLLRPTHA
jgi:hypothetical protein